MDEFVDRAELLRRLDHEYRRFHTAIARLTPAQLQTPGVVGAWSIKDVIAHFIVHEQFALHELEHALRGERYRPEEPETVIMNDRAVAGRRSQSLDDVLQAWNESYHQVVAAVRSLTDAAFDATGPIVQLLEDTIDGALGNNTYGHYAEHLPAIEAWTRQLA